MAKKRVLPRIVRTELVRAKEMAEARTKRTGDAVLARVHISPNKTPGVVYDIRWPDGTVKTIGDTIILHGESEDIHLKTPTQRKELSKPWLKQ